MHSPKLTIWMGFSSEFGLKPYFFTDTINANRYLEMLQQFVVPQLVELNKVTTTTFMHDGASPHIANTVRQYLSDTFGERVIGRGCPINWPACSPHFNPLDYWFWGWIKAKVYHHQPPTSLEQLQTKIEAVCSAINSDDYASAVSNLNVRLQYVISNDGDHFEHLM